MPSADIIVRDFTSGKLEGGWRVAKTKNTSKMLLSETGAARTIVENNSARPL
jgi:hypothetical protein